MVTGTAIKCSREAEHHSGPLRKDGDGFICQECWARENSIELRKSPGKSIVCPKCGNVLMTRYKGGRVSIGSMSLMGGKAILKCECGYEKEIQNPFGRKQTRDEAVFARLRSESTKKKEVKDEG